MTASKSLRPSAKCVNCGTTLAFPEWSENISERKAAYLWHCLACGHEFETTDDRVSSEPSDFELVKEFLPNLLVA